MNLRNFVISAILALSQCQPAFAGISDGQPVNAATTNAAFLDKNTDTTASGKVNLNNASDPSTSGSEIFNSQREFNSLSSYTGKPINQSISYTPVWSNNDVGASTDNLQLRSDLITAKFNGSTGHTHTGAAGDGPPIAATSLSGTLGVAHGGTGRTTLTNHGVLIGAGTSNITQLSAAGAGTLLGGVASSDPAFTLTPVIGLAGTGTGTLGLSGTTSGTVTISPQAAAGTWSFILPTAGGTTGQPLLSGGGGNMTWGTLGAAAGGTGVVSPTAHSVCFGEGSSAMTCTTGAAGTILNAVSGDPQWSSNPQIGAAGVVTGAMTFDGFTSGAVTMQVQSTSGTYNFNLPTSAGSSGQPLLSGGGSGAAQTYGTLGVGAGGTGQTSYTDGQLLIGNTTGNTLTAATLTAGSNVTITNGHGTITIASTAAAGSVAWNYTSQTTTYNATINDYIVASSSSFTITLPTAVSQAGKGIIIEHGGTSLSQKYTLNTTSSQTIGGVASGSYVLTTNGEVLYVVSDGSNWQIVSHQATLGWTSYTPSAFGAGFGTPTGVHFYYRRDHDNMYIKGYFTIGTIAGSLASFTIPSNATINTTVMGLGNTTGSTGELIGHYGNPTTAANGYLITATGTSTSTIYFGGLLNGTSGVTPVNGSAVFNSSTFTTVQVGPLPISDWQP